MAANPQVKSRTITVWALRAILGFVFLALGITKLTGTANMVEYFAAIGWGQWFRYLTGVLDLAGAAMLFVPRLTFYGALALGCTVGTALILSLTVLRSNPTWSAPQNVLVPLVLTSLAALLAWLTRPR
jgi:uncharacterized membrane protein YphA (DoxX/SURF4 family)